MNESQNPQEEKYAISDFIYWLDKYNNINEIKWTKEEIAALIARAMINFFPDTNTPY